MLYTYLQNRKSALFAFEKFLFFLLLLFWLSPAFGLSLKEEFSKAEPGDFVVFSHQKQITLLRIFAKKQETRTLLLEEITAPESVLKTIEGNWQHWLDEEAPGSTSWTISTLDVETGDLLSVYSVHSSKWMPVDRTFSFLSTLWQLPLQSQEPQFRKYIGAPPLPGEWDMRKVWYPKIIFSGQQEPQEIEIFQVQWPKDGTEIAGKTIDLYLPRGARSISYFPYWIEIRGKFAKVKLRVIDSGKGSKSPITNLPLLVPSPKSS